MVPAAETLTGGRGETAQTHRRGGAETRRPTYSSRRARSGNQREKTAADGRGTEEVPPLPAAPQGGRTHTTR